LPRYRNPADSGQTWTGRGRQPRWIAEALASGRSLDEFKI
jgi:DNA-binding protein H-NS